MSVTRAAFRSALRGRLGPQKSSAPFWSDTELHAAIHEALRTWNTLTGYWTGRAVLRVDANITFISISPNMTAGSHAFWRGKPLDQTSLFELDQAIPSWQSETADAPKVWVPIATNLIAIYPKLTEASTSLLIDGVLKTPAFTADTDEITLHEDDFEILLDYARHLLLFKIPANPEFKTSQEARKALWKAAGDHNQQLKATSIYRAVLGLPADSAERPLRRGEGAVGVRA